MPFDPINYSLAYDKLRAILDRTAPTAIVVDDTVPARVGQLDGFELITRGQILAELLDA